MNVKTLKLGVYAGLAGGVVSGVILGFMGTLPMIGQMAGHPSAAAGFLVHLVISALIGALFSLFYDSLAPRENNGLVYGLLYGAAWWLLGPLTVMPLLMGMGLAANWNAESAVAMLPSLVGHFIYGAILGAVHVWLSNRAIDSERPFDPQIPTLAQLCMDNSLQSNITLEKRRIG